MLRCKLPLARFTDAMMHIKEKTKSHTTENKFKKATPKRTKEKSKKRMSTRPMDSRRLHKGCMRLTRTSEQTKISQPQTNQTTPFPTIHPTHQLHHSSVIIHNHEAKPQHSHNNQQNIEYTSNQT
jgi:hypothetical protein